MNRQTPVHVPPQTGGAPPPPRNEEEAQLLLRRMKVDYDNILKNTLREASSPTSLSADDVLQMRIVTRKVINFVLEMWPPRFGDAAYDHTALDIFFKLQTNKNLFYWRIFRINDLPLEILRIIFHFVVWSCEDQKSVDLSRLYLTWTCRRWRSLTVADSVLWNSIWFRRNSYEMEYTSLERAGTAPLYIRIHERGDLRREDAADTAEHLVNICRKLFVKLEQIHAFGVVVRSWQQVTAVLKMLAEPENVGRACSLQQFELHNMSWEWANDESVSSAGNPLPLCGNSAPSLKDVRLHGVFIDWDRSPLQNLTTLDLRRVPLPLSMTLPRFREILKNCPDLHKLSLHSFGPQRYPRSPAFKEPVLLPKLVSLFLGGLTLSFGNYVLDNFSAPNVRDLTLANFDGEEYAPMAFKITAMFPQVQLLTISAVSMGNHPAMRKIMVKWLHSMPNLRYLRIASIRPHILQVFLHDPAVYGVDIDENGNGVSNSETDHTIVENVDSGTADAETQTTITENISRLQKISTSRVLAPKLSILEYDTMDTQTIVTFGKGRRTIGVPLKKIYVSAPWVPRIDMQGRNDLCDIATLCVARAGSIMPEQAEILGDVAD
jgi:hypothetical protein